MVAAVDPAGRDRAAPHLPDPGLPPPLRTSPVGRRTTRARPSGSDGVAPAKRSRASALPLIERETRFKQMLRDTMDSSLS